MEERRCHARTGHAEGVAESDGAAQRVDLILSGAEKRVWSEVRIRGEVAVSVLALFFSLLCFPFLSFPWRARGGRQKHAHAEQEGGQAESTRVILPFRHAP